MNTMKHKCRGGCGASTQASYIDEVSIPTDKTERKTEERLFENGARQNRLFEKVT